MFAVGLKSAQGLSTMRNSRSHLIDRIMLVVAIVIFATTFSFAALALHDQLVSDSQALPADNGSDKAR